MNRREVTEKLRLKTTAEINIMGYVVLSHPIPKIETVHFGKLY